MAALTGHSYIIDRRCESCYHGVMSPSETIVCSSGTIYVCGSCGAERHVLDAVSQSSKPTKRKIKNAGKIRCKKCKTWFINGGLVVLIGVRGRIK